MRILKPVFTILVLALAIFVFYQFVIFPMLKPQIKVVHLIDPDSLLVMENGKLSMVQLIGTDSPELTGTNKDRQCYDYQARRLAAIRYFSSNHEIKLASDPVVGDKDIYGRPLRYVYLNDGTLYNEVLIRDGLAKESNPQNKAYKEKESFFKAQEEAKAAEAGIWNKKTCRGVF